MCEYVLSTNHVVPLRNWCFEVEIEYIEFCYIQRTTTNHSSRSNGANKAKDEFVACIVDSVDVAHRKSESEVKNMFREYENAISGDRHNVWRNVIIHNGLTHTPKHTT